MVTIPLKDPRYRVASFSGTISSLFSLQEIATKHVIIRKVCIYVLFFIILLVQIPGEHNVY